MTKDRMAGELLEALQKQRQQAYIENLSRIITRMDKDKREMFADAYYSLVEELENREMARHEESFRGWSGRTLELIFSSPVGPASFGPGDMPTRRDLRQLESDAYHLASCPKCASQLYR
ncbi:hypothetical protein MYX06_02320 [Patescibacteria group bacterium AH-259-L05]|nr:hypothetical protein [Patescibacteria group bacterium AH-259-L05]